MADANAQGCKRSLHSADLAEGASNPLFAKRRRCGDEDALEAVATQATSKYGATFNDSSEKEEDISPLGHAAHHALASTSSDSVSSLQTNRPSLLALPPEIRNLIWTYALQQPDNINVTSALRHPALLATSRPVRTETHKLYFTLNTFNVHIYDLDAKLFRLWCKTVARVTGAPDTRFCRMLYKFHRGNNFDNLIKWCHWVHKDELAPVPAISASMGPNAMVAKVALDLTMRSLAVPWTSCRRSLEGLRTMCGMLNASWKK